MKYHRLTKHTPLHGFTYWLNKHNQIAENEKRRICLSFLGLYFHPMFNLSCLFQLLLVHYPQFCYCILLCILYKMHPLFHVKILSKTSCSNAHRLNSITANCKVGGTVQQAPFMKDPSLFKCMLLLNLHCILYRSTLQLQSN